MIDSKELLEYKKSINKKDLEVFNIQNLGNEAFRSYLYKRMNNVSKLVWKL